MLIIICQAHLLAGPLTIPLMYNLVLWNNFLKQKNKKNIDIVSRETGQLKTGCAVSKGWETKITERIGLRIVLLKF